MSLGPPPKSTKGKPAKRNAHPVFHCRAASEWKMRAGAGWDPAVWPAAKHQAGLRKPCLPRHPVLGFRV